jgi:hypothetical protein
MFIDKFDSTAKTLRLTFLRPKCLGKGCVNDLDFGLNTGVFVAEDV